MSCRISYRIPITPGKAYTLSWYARTAQAGHEYAISFPSHDESGEWIPHFNYDVSFAGSTAWKRESLRVVFTDRCPKARSVRFRFWPTKWTEGGELTGTAWFDEFSLVESGSSVSLIKNGGFEVVKDRSVQVHSVDMAECGTISIRYTPMYPNEFAAWILGLGEIAVSKTDE